MTHAAIWLEITVAILLASYRPVADKQPRDLTPSSPSATPAVGPESRDVVHFDAPIHGQTIFLR